MKKTIPTLKRSMQKLEGDQYTNFLTLPIYAVYLKESKRFQIFIGDKPVCNDNKEFVATKKCISTFYVSSFMDCDDAMQTPDKVVQLDMIDWKQYNISIEKLMLEHQKQVITMNNVIAKLNDMLIHECNKNFFERLKDLFKKPKQFDIHDIH